MRAAAAGLIAISLAASGDAAVHRVPSEYSTITAAVAAAGQGDTVLVAPGVYNETVRLDRFISLISEEGPEVTVIDAGGAYEDVVWIYEGLMGQGDGWLVTGFTVRNGHVGIAVAAEPKHLPVVVRDCVIRDNASTGIAISSNAPTIEDCAITDNGGDGVALYETGVVLRPTEIVGNLIAGNGYVGFTVYTDQSDFTLQHNTIDSNRMGVSVARWSPCGPGIVSSNVISRNETYGIWISQPWSPYSCDGVQYNDIWGNGEDVAPESDCYDEIIGYNGNFSSDPDCCNPEEYDFTLADCSPCLGAGEGGTDVGAFGLGCGQASLVVETKVSWGLLKALYR